MTEWLNRLTADGAHAELRALAAVELIAVVEILIRGVV
jgi:hypothetical protein